MTGNNASLKSSGTPLIDPPSHELVENTSISVNVRPISASLVSNLSVKGTSESHVGEVVEVPQSMKSREEESEELEGLSNQEAERLLKEYGPNEIPEKITPWYINLAKQFVGVMPFMLEFAAIVSISIQDYADFGIILAMLILNALIGFHEEEKAKQSLDALKSQMTATVPVKRNGEVVILPARELVPGDIVFLRGGNVVPADCHWMEGDEMQVDTAALTGEPLPRKVPRPDKPNEEPGAGRELLSGCIIRQGEGLCKVLKTGLNTEIGAAAGLVQEASGHEAGVFETKIMQIVKCVIFIAIINAGIILYVQVGIRGNDKFQNVLLAVLAIVIGAVPIALPLVMQVTMAIGAKTMAKEKAIVTHLTALQEIASMTVLCSDKTGTLTTAQMRVLPSHVWTINEKRDQNDILMWAGVASNDANKEDPIDSSVLQSCEEFLPQQKKEEMRAYKKKKFVGFNPTTKRSIAYVEDPKRGNLKIAKGLISKVLSTGDDGGDCWEVADLADVKGKVEEQDVQLSTLGYKTIGVALSENDGPMKFEGILPMLDPPRHDTMLTIYRIREAGINVKMITGDHLNIAIETSKLIGLGFGIRAAADLWPASEARNEMIKHSDGFAQVLPKDKREVILVLKKFGYVVGMTGDGVNDAPALAEAQIGIAVDGATEAARSAADIILTEPGLSAIFGAVIESRKIFARLRAYVLYRMAATIQIVVVLSVMVYGFNVTMKPLYVILLALFNDISMLPIADDNACPSSKPEIPSLPQIMTASAIYGGLLILQTLAMFLYARSSNWLSDTDKMCEWGSSCEYIGSLTYVQISIAIEFVIFSCRTPGFMLSPKFLLGDGRPSWKLVVGTVGSNIIVTLLAVFGVIVYKLHFSDIIIIWVYNFAGIVVIDFVKVFLSFVGIPLMTAGASSEVLGYPEMPEGGVGQGPNRSLLRSGTRDSIRSVQHIRSTLSRTSREASILDQVVPATDSVGSKKLRKSSSLLPFPHGVRADLNSSGVYSGEAGRGLSRSF
jgi:H+-transporting ATPase